MATKFSSGQENVSNNQKSNDIDSSQNPGSTCPKPLADSSYNRKRSNVNFPQALPSNYLPNNSYQVLPPRGVMTQNLPPPIPPRPGQMSNFPNYSPFGTGNMYNSFPRYGSGMYAPSYGGYRTAYNRYGSYYDGGMENNSIIQMAEESTRPAFQSIESIVEAVGSISMMLESTYHAVHSSYSAILGVVDHFSRLKDRLTEILSFLALLRGLRWLCLKVLYLLGIRKSDPSTEAAWSAASNAANNLFNSNDETDTKQSAWPIFIFISLVFGAPWLMFRLFANKTAAKKTIDAKLWMNSHGNYYTAMALYDFTAARPAELSVRAGQKIILAPKSLQPNIKNWVLVSQDLKTSGLVPTSYLRKISGESSQVCKAATDQNIMGTADLPPNLPQDPPING